MICCTSSARAMNFEALRLDLVEQGDEVLVIDEVDVEEGLPRRVALDHQLPEHRRIGIAGLEEGVDLVLEGRDFILERPFRLAVDPVDHVPGCDLFVGQLQEGGHPIVGGLDDRRRLHLLGDHGRHHAQGDQCDEYLLHLVQLLSELS